VAGVLAVVVPLVAGLATGLTVVNREEATVGETRVAAVQGNVPRMGLDFNAQRRAVLANHVQVTEDLAGEELDLVIWPENSSDVNPFADSAAGELVDRAVRAVDTPVLVGTITRDEVGDRNTMVVMDPDTGRGDQHNKHFLQPFGEYMPMRDFFRMFSEYVDQAGNFQPGPPEFTVRMRDVVVGVATCYEVAFDPALRSAVRDGAQLLTTPTNNATFGFTDMTYQQLAMSRLRAIEVDRAVVVAATSGVSAIVHPDGSVSQETGIFEADSLVETLPLRDSLTIAARYGAAIQTALILLGGLLFITALVTGRRRDTA
ncbi:apolipoprotein N-acyltransferase, partial [Corynebacterium nasicanis]